MNDKTTDGYHATPDEIEGMLRNLCAYAMSEPEPLQRYIDLTHQQVLFDGVVNAIRRERGKALGDLAAAGTPVPTVAKLARLETPQQVKSLLSAAGVPIPATPRKKAAKPLAVTSVPSQRAKSEQIVPDGKRTLTPQEREALGLPDPFAAGRGRSFSNR